MIKVRDLFLRYPGVLTKVGLLIIRPQYVQISKERLSCEDLTELFAMEFKKEDFSPAAISLQSSVGRCLMNYLLSEVMFTSLYIYWDSPQPPRPLHFLVLLEKIKF